MRCLQSGQLRPEAKRHPCSRSSRSHENSNQQVFRHFHNSGCAWFDQISQLNLIPAAVRRLHLPPWKGKPIIAQDKRATSAVLGKRPYQPVYLFSCFATPTRSAGKTGKKGCVHFWSRYPDVPAGIRFGSLRSQMPNAAPHLPPPRKKVELWGALRSNTPFKVRPHAAKVRSVVEISSLP